MRTLKEQLEALQENVGNGLGDNQVRFKILNPKPFNGSRDVKILVNYIYDLEQYFQVTHVGERDKLTVVTMFLSRDTKMW